MKADLLFPQRLRELMESRGLSAAGLARKIGVSHVAVGNWLKGATLSSDKVPQLADALGVSTDELLRGKDFATVRASLRESSEFATRVAEGPPDQIGQTVFELRAENEGLKKLIKRAAAQLREVASSLDELST